MVLKIKIFQKIILLSEILTDSRNGKALLQNKTEAEEGTEEKIENEVEEVKGPFSSPKAIERTTHKSCKSDENIYISIVNHRQVIDVFEEYGPNYMTL